MLSKVKQSLVQRSSVSIQCSPSLWIEIWRVWSIGIWACFNLFNLFARLVMLLRWIGNLWLIETSSFHMQWAAKNPITKGTIFKRAGCTAWNQFIIIIIRTKPTVYPTNASWNIGVVCLWTHQTEKPMLQKYQE